MPAQSNATITAVRGHGKRDDWDRNQGGEAGPYKWEGAARAYYREATDRDRTGAAVDVSVRRELIVDTADVDAMTVDTDDVLEFTVDGEAGARTGTPQAIRRARLDGIPAALQTSKLTLDPA